MLMAARFPMREVITRMSGPSGSVKPRATGIKLQEGLYKVEFYTVHGTGSGVVYATSGKLRGGNSGFAFVGSYTGEGDDIHVKISTRRHNDDPALKPLFGTDMITLMLKGTQNGDIVDFEGAALQVPGVAFKAVLTRIAD
jgi:T3SS negative regulator,GrlR